MRPCIQMDMLSSVRGITMDGCDDNVRRTHREKNGRVFAEVLKGMSEILLPFGQDR